MAISKNIKIPELKNYRFKGVEIFSIETDNVFELNVYLLDDDLKEIFSLFIQNILEDIAKCNSENEALAITLNIISRWKRLFDKINFNGLSIEQQKGLIGELLFFNYLIDNNKSPTDILKAWSGPDFEDKDFVFGSIGVEVKMTSSKYPKINITNERQLEFQNLSELFLILYITEEVKENGFSLNSLIDQIREKISTNIEDLEYFNQRLLLLGYFDDDIEYYKKMYSLKEILSFIITSEFPSITKNNIPLGVFNVSYCIELSAAEKFITHPENIVQKVG